ncbi:LamG-like jellyroll fold domain-containing protein [Brumimicrobium mesophilum]|uniref:LamG-like jellyroll fold domain-containing protein n=1 Tax=Brumimicrobium mesophilum TaxID=392717 RepID=UPI00131BDC26|nr:LamG-like jellyroll fold domain-containing protein [Brumimicrobium mesophilum]
MRNLLLSALAFALTIQSTSAQNINNALNFENESYININSISSSVQNLNAFTIEFWVNFSAQDNTDYNCFYGVNPGDYTNRFNFRFAGPQDNISDAAVVFIEDQNGNQNWIIGNTTIGNNRCHHLAFTFQNSACSLYVDGQLDATGTHNFAFKPEDLHSLGQEFDPATNPVSQLYNGEMDDFRIWNYAKTQNQIINGKNMELAGTEQGLLVYFDFNQGNPNGNNTNISTLVNKANASQSGSFNSFSLNGNSSNFVSGECNNLHVGIEKEEDLKSLNIGPNPTTGKINISNPETISAITVRDNLGKIVLNAKVNSLIDISHLSQGIYFFEITGKKGEFKNIKVLKK